MPESKQNILNFSYSVNFKCEGRLWQFFDRFYVVTEFELPKIEDLHLTTIQFDSTCSYLDTGKGRKNNPTDCISIFMAYCQKIVSFVNFYEKQIAYYKQTAYEILTNENVLILPIFPRDKRGIISSLVSGFINLAYNGISSFLLYRHQNALCKTVTAMESKVYLQCNKIFHLEDSMIMYGIHNSDTLEQLIETVHRMHNTTHGMRKYLLEEFMHGFSGIFLEME